MQCKNHWSFAASARDILPQQLCRVILLSARPGVLDGTAPAYGSRGTGRIPERLAVGFGGMSVIVPALIHAGLTVPDAFANAFAVTAINSAVAWLMFHRRGYVDYRRAVALVLPAVPASILAFAAMLWAGAANLAALMLGIFLLAMGAAVAIAPCSVCRRNCPARGWGVAGGASVWYVRLQRQCVFHPCAEAPWLASAPKCCHRARHRYLHCRQRGCCLRCLGDGGGGVAVDPYMVGYLTIGGLVTGRLGGFLKMKTPPLQLSIVLCAAYLASGTLLVAKHVPHRSASTATSGAPSVKEYPSVGPELVTRRHTELLGVSISSTSCRERECAPPFLKNPYRLRFGVTEHQTNLQNSCHRI